MNQFPPSPRVFHIDRFKNSRRYVFASQGAPPGINDTGGKFATGVNDTGGKLAAGINDTDGKFATGVNDAGGKQWEQLSNADNLK
jgi:hypothetical protein